MTEKKSQFHPYIFEAYLRLTAKCPFGEALGVRGAGGGGGGRDLEIENEVFSEEEDDSPETLDSEGNLYFLNTKDSVCNYVDLLSINRTVATL